MINNNLTCLLGFHTFDDDRYKDVYLTLCSTCRRYAYDQIPERLYEIISYDPLIVRNCFGAKQIEYTYDPINRTWKHL